MVFHVLNSAKKLTSNQVPLSTQEFKHTLKSKNQLFIDKNGIADLEISGMKN